MLELNDSWMSTPIDGRQICVTKDGHYHRGRVRVRKHLNALCLRWNFQRNRPDRVRSARDISRWRLESKVRSSKRPRRRQRTWWDSTCFDRMILIRGRFGMQWCRTYCLCGICSLLRKIMSACAIYYIHRFAHRLFTQKHTHTHTFE